MVGMAPYPMDGHGAPHQAMMMMMQGPGGYVMVQPNMQGMMMRGVGEQDQAGGQTGHGHPGMQNMQGLPPNMQLMMVQPGMGNMPGGMQVAMQAPPSHGGHGPNDGPNAAQMMMMSNPAGMSGAAGGAMTQAGGMNQGNMVDVDGKGRVAALSRSSQPKQGVGSWHSGDRRGARPPAPGSGGMDHSAGGQNMQGMPFSGTGHHGQMPQGAGMQAAQGSSGDPDAPESTPKVNRITPPQKPWADIQDDPRHGGLDRETQELWQLRHGQSASRMGDTPPQRSQGQQMPKQMQGGGNAASTSGRSKAGRNEGGKGGGGDAKKGSSRASPQEAQPAQKWVEVRTNDAAPPASVGGAGKGQGKASAPQQEMAPKAAAPMPHIPSGQPLLPPAATKGGGGGGGGGGGKKKSRRDHKLDDWLSQRWAGRPQPGGMEGDAAAAGATNAHDWSSSQAADSHAAEPAVSVGGYDDSKDASYHEEYGEEESDGRRGKKKGGKGGKGKSDERRREKGKGKGKNSRGSWWRANN